MLNYIEGFFLEKEEKIYLFSLDYGNSAFRAQLGICVTFSQTEDIVLVVRALPSYTCQDFCASIYNIHIDDNRYDIDDNNCCPFLAVY